jgi:hypothetical protein
MKEESWHYKRVCKECGNTWAGLHCPHDGIQNPCGECGKKPLTEKGECNCEFDWEDDEEGISLPPHY